MNGKRPRATVVTLGYAGVLASTSQWRKRIAPPRKTAPETKTDPPAASTGGETA